MKIVLLQRDLTIIYNICIFVREPKFGGYEKLLLGAKPSS